MRLKIFSLALRDWHCADLMTPRRPGVNKKDASPADQVECSMSRNALGGPFSHWKGTARLSVNPSFIEMPQLLGLQLDKPSTKPVNKCSLEFILSNDDVVEKPARLPSFPWTSPQRGSSNKTFAPVLAPPSGSCKLAKRRPLEHLSVSKSSTKAGLNKATIVLADGTVVKKTSKYCMMEGCTSRAKHARRCWRHGGSVKCKEPGCTNRAKTKGVCWSHGGGTLCSFHGCTTISVSNGVCWAHGGGKRCAREGCARPAYERTNHLCTLHFEEKQEPMETSKLKA
ncbi:hypothetical protein PsorP6_010235 [Peronosclerospora sorghi]|uniref:Uncharacterized protein n=1 Tax=Peronosclerospora sorghi TaxID=230839 RepID=A0ACC0VWS2_9STRA|nr:hypothetical protein PsorP6_010235 [Peronosclerospora sorghi]